MTICDMKRGESAVVLKVELSRELRERMLSFRIHAGAKITMLKVSPFKKTYLLQAGSSRVALARDAALGVRVWRT